MRRGWKSFKVCAYIVMNESLRLSLVKGEKEKSRTAEKISICLENT
jgi:hypothetical protein